MYRNTQVTLSFPPFTRAVKGLILANAAIYLLMLLIGRAAPQLAGQIIFYLGLIPAAVTHGWLWQIFTYSFLHSGFFHVGFNMLALWMFGSLLEIGWGRRQFLEFYFFCVAGAALTSVVMSYTGVLGLSPATVTIGASGGVYGVLMAYGMLFGDRELMMFPFPFLIRAKYFVGVLIFVSLAGALGEAGGVAYIAHLGGLLFGYLYVRFLLSRGLALAFSERWFGLRNAWGRHQRRQAARKFEVYMRQHEQSRTEESPHEEMTPPAGKKNGEHRGPWIN
ncbi:MAG: rhomboid family intramembrane serine protease [Terriglobales bacterium]